MFLEDVSELSRWSHKQVSVVCDFQDPELCLGKVKRMYMNVRTTMDKNDGRYICPSCLKMRRSGRNNPNCRYKELDDHLMDTIDSDVKAYLLGWIAADGTISPNGNIGIAVSTCDVGVLETICDFICPNLPIADCKEGTMKVLRICSSQWCKAIKKHLNLSFEKGESHKKSHLVQMPVDISDSLKWCFLRGLFEGDGCISIAKSPRGWADGLRVSIGSSSLAMQMMIVTLCRSLNINICMSSNEVRFHCQYAARFLEKYMRNATKNLYLSENMIFINS